MPRRAPEAALAWLRGDPDLKTLRAEYPEEWETVERELADILGSGRTEELRRFLVPPVFQPGHERKVQAASVARMIRGRMAYLAIKSYLLAAAAGTGGKIRFNWFNGFVAQRLLFARELERKPVSLTWFRRLWPLLWQRRRLMPLVQPRGIYCFYSRELIDALARLIDGRPCLEIAAGDGTLSRFLRERGVNVRATDDHSWSQAIRYPDWVERLDAQTALKRHAPEVVLCSWPPANNNFERQVFRTPGVRLYIMIGSRHSFAAGNWREYRAQTGFRLELDEALSALVLPPELAPAVYVFRAATSPGT